MENSLISLADLADSDQARTVTVTGAIENLDTERWQLELEFAKLGAREHVKERFDRELFARSIQQIDSELMS